MIPLCDGPNAGRQVRVIPLSRPIRPPIDWRHEYTQAELDAHARHVAERRAHRDAFLQTWTPLFPAEPQLLGEITR